MFRLPRYVKKWWPEKVFTWKEIDSIPNCIGVYELMNQKRDVIYVGKTSILRRRLFQHYYVNDILDVNRFRCYHISKLKYASDFEAWLIAERNPVHNVKRPRCRLIDRN